ncbi:peptidase G2 autoproteolytic cleavage domain-containing protein [Jiangella alba]|nr:peptidase G2 autoproteolytic cleavage domain-containing protein [Jiangella alba]
MGTISAVAASTVASSATAAAVPPGLRMLASSPVEGYLTAGEVTAAAVDPAVDFLQTQGYHAAGDGGGALYQRVTAQPAHAGALQSADGAWWELLSPEPNPVMFGAAADGTTADDAVFQDLETYTQNQQVDLLGKTYAFTGVPPIATPTVTPNPYTNNYVNGFFASGGQTLSADFDRTLVADTVDTGGVEPAYPGGANGTPTISGRTNRSLRLVMASQNSRSQAARSVNVGSAFCWALGNVSGNYSARQSVAQSNQSVNVGTEECEVYGSRGGNYSAVFSHSEGLGDVNIATRHSYTSAEYCANIASHTSDAGGGRGFRGEVVVTGGAVTGVTVLDPGTRYSATDELRVRDRVAIISDDAVVTPVVDANGGITGVTVVHGGSGYTAGRVDINPVTPGYMSANLATQTSRTFGRTSANVATAQAETHAELAFNLGSETSTASGRRSGSVGGSGCTTSGAGAIALGAVNSQATADGAVVIGRRTINDQVRSLALGDSAAGAASTANRRHHLFQNGNYQLAGTVTGSTPFTDYAEYFENAAAGVIALGSLVALDGATVRPASGGDAVLGVVSATALVAAGDSPFTWSGRYLTGEFGEPILEQVPDPDWPETVPDPEWTPGTDEHESERPQVPNPQPRPTITVRAENPDYDPGQANVPRSERPEEWTCVGLLGQVHLRVDDTVQAGSRVTAGADGVGTAGENERFIQCMELRQPYDAAKGYAVAFCLIR